MGLQRLGAWGWVARSLLVVVLGGGISASATAAEEKPQPAKAATDESTMSAPVVIDGATLFKVRGIQAFPADRRALQIQQRIEAAANTPSLPADALTVTETADGSRIAAGDRVILTVLDLDAELGQAERKLLARVYAKRISEAIVAYRHDRSKAYLLRSAGAVLAASVGLALFLWAGARAVRRIDEEMDKRVKHGLSGLETRSKQLVSASQMWGAFLGVRRFVWTMAAVVGVVFYLDYVLHLFPWTRQFAMQMWSLLVDPLRSMGQSFLVTIPDLAFLVILFVVTRYVLKTINLFFTALADGHVRMANFEPDWAMPTYRLIRILVVAFAIVVAYPYIPGSDSDAFKGVSLFLGVIFSLGSSSVIGNVIAGYTMIYRRAFRVGDRVKIDEHVGDVTAARLLVTHIRTPKNEEIIIPNTIILSNSVVNYSTLAREGKLILHASVGIGYETPWRQVEAMLLQAADRCEGLLKTPKPFVLQKALGDFAVTYEVNVYCDDAQAMNRLYTQLYQNILDLFNEYGVQIMTPAYEGDPEQPKIVPRDQWYAAPAAAPVEVPLR